MGSGMRTEASVLAFQEPDSRSNAGERSAMAFDALPAVTAVLDPGGRVIQTNRAWRLFGVLNGATGTYIEENYLDACDVGAATGAPGALEVADGLRAVLEGQRSHFEHEYACDAPHQPRWFLLQAAPLADGRGAVVTHVDISRRKQLEEGLRQMVDQDPLTGLATRTVIDDRMSEVERRGGAVLLCDLDGFKAVNDTHGHLIGDELLVQTGMRLRHTARAGLAGRLGGDEFVVVHPGVVDGRELAERCRLALSAPYQVGDLELRVGCSVGLATSQGGEVARDLLRRADQSMYAEKVRRGSHR